MKAAECLKRRVFGFYEPKITPLTTDVYDVYTIRENDLILKIFRYLRKEKKNRKTL